MGRGLEYQQYPSIHPGESAPGRERQRKVGAELKQWRRKLDGRGGGDRKENEFLITVRGSQEVMPEINSNRSVLFRNTELKSSSRS